GLELVILVAHGFTFRVVWSVRGPADQGLAENVESRQIGGLPPRCLQGCLRGWRLYSGREGRVQGWVGPALRASGRGLPASLGGPHRATTHRWVETSDALCLAVK